MNAYEDEKKLILKNIKEKGVSEIIRYIDEYSSGPTGALRRFVIQTALLSYVENFKEDIVACDYIKKYMILE